MTCPLKQMRWADVLMTLYNIRDNQRYCEKLCRAVPCSKSRIREVAADLESCSLIDLVPHKNVKKLVLTEKGHRVTKALFVIHTELNSVDSASPIEACA